jgi:hypothetical protein
MKNTSINSTHKWHLILSHLKQSAKNTCKLTKISYKSFRETIPIQDLGPLHRFFEYDFEDKIQCLTVAINSSSIRRTASLNL